MTPSRLSSIDQSPPPLFKPGVSARVKVFLYAILAVALLIGDSHLHVLMVARQMIGTALYPFQKMALTPRDFLTHVTGYLQSFSDLKKENAKLHLEKIQHAQQWQQAQSLISENAQLRRLLGMEKNLFVKSLLAEVLYDARNPFTRKIIVGRGSQHGVQAGQPVIDPMGIIGQVTRVFPLSSEITLLTDKDQEIPVQVLRSGLRSIAYGSAQPGFLALRFVPTNADIQIGDILVTSGIDHVYPEGLNVAKVFSIQSTQNNVFLHVLSSPMAGIDQHRYLLILLVDVKPSMRPTDLP